MKKTGFIYIVANKPNGTLYVGVTTDLLRRIYEHRESIYEGFTKEHNLKKLVYYEEYESYADAIHREKRLKEWQRQWKIDLIKKMNPKWDDLYETLNK